MLVALHVSGDDNVVVDRETTVGVQINTVKLFGIVKLLETEREARYAITETDE